MWRWRCIVALAMAAGGWLIPSIANAGVPVEYGPPARYAAGDGIRALAADDFDGDGFADVLVRDSSGRLTIQRGDGQGRLVGLVDAGVAPQAEVAQVDGQRAPDLLSALEGETGVTARVRLGGAIGGFGPVLESPVGPLTGRLRGLEAGEFDGQPGADLLLFSAEDGGTTTLWVAAGSGDGTFARAWRAGSTPGSADGAALPDVNADGRQELAAPGPGGRLWLSLSDPSEGFAPASGRRVAASGGELGPMTVGRFARGGPPVLALADPTGSCIALVPLVVGVADPGRCFASSGRVEGLTAADVDGDGVTELLHGRSGGGVALLSARADGLGTPAVVGVGPASFSSDPLAPDLDGDGRADLVAVADLRALAVLRNVGEPRPVLTPASLAFPDQPVGSVGGAEVVRLRNTGTRALQVGRSVLTGAGAPAFEIAADLCAGQVLGHGRTCSVRVRFRPLDAGPQIASLIIPTSASTQSLEAPLIGTAAKEAVTVTSYEVLQPGSRRGQGEGARSGVLVRPAMAGMSNRVRGTLFASESEN